jgi:hypothetical protein
MLPYPQGLKGCTEVSVKAEEVLSDISSKQ